MNSNRYSTASGLKMTRPTNIVPFPELSCSPKINENVRDFYEVYIDNITLNGGFPIDENTLTTFIDTDSLYS